MMASVNLPTMAGMLGIPYAGPSISVRKLELDSRRVGEGDMFVAIPGEHVDGHDFVAKAVQGGAIAALVERPVDTSIPCLQVESSLEALSEIGAANRRAFTGTVVAITGSCGKTSVKNMCRSVFAAAGETLATPGNYNNEIGVPLTLTGLDDNTRYAIIEMGAAGRGHVAHLCQLAKPQISTVLNAMEAHLDGFGSVDDVADMKAEIFDALGSSDTAILNLDEPWAELWQRRIKASGAGVVTYSIQGDADITAREQEDRGLAGSRFVLCRSGEELAVNLPHLGRHNIANALATAALASAAGLPLKLIVEGLQSSEGEAGRLQRIRLRDGTIVIDDTYNANPGSVRAAIELLASTAGRNAIVMGEMLELGPRSAPLHLEMGELARSKGIDGFVGVGPALQPAVDAFGAGGLWFEDKASLASQLSSILRDFDTVLVKGSRGSAMETLLRDLPTSSERAAQC